MMRSDALSYGHDRSPDSYDEILALQRSALAGLLRSEAIARGDIATALGQITEAASRVLRVRRASIWRVDATRTRIDCLDMYDAETRTHSRGVALHRKDAPRYFDAALTERCIVADDARTDPRTSEFTETYLVPNRIMAMLDAPILVRGELVGVVCHEHIGDARAWRPWEELAAGTVADIVGMAMSSAEHAEQVRTAETLKRSEEMLRTMLDAAPVPLVVTSQGDAIVRFGNKRAADMFATTVEDFVGKRAPEIYEDPAERQAFADALAKSGHVDGFPARLRDGHGHAFWALVSARSMVLEDERVFMIGFSDVTAQKETEHRLRDLASLDGLTGVFNRRHFFEAAGDALASSERRARAACVAILDVDHFKKVNDTFGHAAGDDALRMLARVCANECRSSDFVGRYGGEEFVIYLSEASIDVAKAVVERIRRALRTERVVCDSGEIMLTVSAGIAERRNREPLDALLRRADEALYEAKRAGRDRVIASP